MSIFKFNILKKSRLNLYNNPLSYFQKNIILMFKGTFIAQVIGMIGSLILAKIYGSEAYGIFGIYISTSTTLALFNTLQLDYSIITIKDKDESKNLMNSLFLITLVLSCFSFLIYFLIPDFLIVKNSNLIIITIFASIIFSFKKIHEAYFTLTRKFKIISKAKIVITFSNILFQIILYKQFKLMGLVYGSIISIIIITIYYFINNKNIKKVNISKLKSTIKSNKNNIKYILPSSLINAFAINLIPILIASLFNLKEFGVYFLSLRILSTPLFLITSSIAQVYYEKSTQIFQFSKEKLYKLTKHIVLINIGLMLLFLFFINTIGIYLLELMFNNNWENLRLYTFILSFIVLARTSFNPISDIVIVLNKNHISLAFNVYLFIINLIGVYIGYIYNNLNFTITIISVFGGLGYFLNLFYFLKKLKDLENKNLFSNKK